MLEINIDKKHDGSFVLSTILEDEQRHSKRYIGYDKKTALRKFRKEVELKNLRIKNDNFNRIAECSYFN